VVLDGRDSMVVRRVEWLSTVMWVMPSMVMAEQALLLKGSS
jgi:hypothetical protein